MLRWRKVHADYVDLRTSAYLHLIKMQTVKKLLGSRVTSLELTATLRLLSGDDRVTTTRLLLESRAIEKANAASSHLVFGTVPLQLCTFRSFAYVMKKTGKIMII